MSFSWKSSSAIVSSDESSTGLNASSLNVTAICCHRGVARDAVELRVVHVLHVALEEGLLVLEDGVHEARPVDDCSPAIPLALHPISSARAAPTAAPTNASDTPTTHTALTCGRGKR